MFSDLNRVRYAISGAPGRGGGGAASTIRRETVAAWLVGASIWLAGLGFLAVQTSPGAYAGTAAAEPASTAYYQLPSSNTYFQDVTGRYPVVVRAIRPVNCG